MACRRIKAFSSKRTMIMMCLAEDQACWHARDVRARAGFPSDTRPPT